MGKCLSRERSEFASESYERDAGGQDPPELTGGTSMVPREGAEAVSMAANEDTSTGRILMVSRAVQTDEWMGLHGESMADISGAVDRVDNSIKCSDDVIFEIQGRKISAGRDFLSLHSEVFNVLLNDDKYVDRMKDEIHLERIEYDDFDVMLAFLSDPNRPIQAEAVDALLILGDRYDIKCLMDRVEAYLIGTNVYSHAQKLLLAERFRLVRLQTWCCTRMNRICVPNCPSKESVMNSDEFGELSDAARRAFLAAADPPFFPNPDNELAYSIRPDMQCAVMSEVEERVAPANGFVASGVLRVQFCSGQYDYNSIDLGGLVWSVSELDEQRRTEWDYLEGRQQGVTPYLVVNFDHPSTVDWTAQGFVTVELAVYQNDGMSVLFQVMKTYSFSLTNSLRIGKMGEIVSKDELNSFTLMHDFGFMTFHIHITSVSGVRKSPVFDFTIQSPLSDAVAVVEGRKVHVNKQFLSTVFPSLKQLFNDENQLRLEHVKYEDFIAFLNWIYPSARRDMIAYGMFGVMRVARQLGVTVDVTNVKTYLMDSHFDSLFIERVIFHHEFGLDLGPMGLVSKSNAWTLFKRSNLFGRMTMEPKDRLYEFIYSTDFEADADSDED